MTIDYSNPNNLNFLPYFDFILQYGNDLYADVRSRTYDSRPDDEILSSFQNIYWNEHYNADHVMLDIRNNFNRGMSTAYAPFEMEHWNSTDINNDIPWTGELFNAIIEGKGPFFDMQNPKLLYNLINQIRNTYCRRLSYTVPIYEHIYNNATYEYAVPYFMKERWNTVTWVRGRILWLKYVISFRKDENVRLDISATNDYLRQYNTILSDKTTNVVQTSVPLTGEEPWYDDLKNYMRRFIFNDYQDLEGVQLYRTEPLVTGINSLYPIDNPHNFPGVWIKNDLMDMSEFIVAKGGKVNNPRLPIIL